MAKSEKSRFDDLEIPADEMSVKELHDLTLGGERTNKWNQPENGKTPLGHVATEGMFRVADAWGATLEPAEELDALVEEHASKARDVVAKPGMVWADNHLRLEWDDDSAPITEKGLARVCASAGLPRAMVEWLVENREVADLPRYYNKAMKGEPRLIRLYDGRVRTTQSEGYPIFDARDLTTRLPAQYLEGGKVHRLRLDERGISAALLLADRHQRDGGKDYGIGLDYGVNEVGGGSAYVNPWAFVTICVNGMVWGRRKSSITFRQVHRGRIDASDASAAIKAVTELSLGFGDALLNALQHSKTVKVKYPEKTIVAISQVLRIPQSTAANWIEGYKESINRGHVEPGNWNAVINGLTLAAHKYDDAQSLEETAGSLLIPSDDFDLRATIAQWSKFESLAEHVSEEEVNKVYVVLQR